MGRKKSAPISGQWGKMSDVGSPSFSGEAPHPFFSSSEGTSHQFVGVGLKALHPESMPRTRHRNEARSLPFIAIWAAQVTKSELKGHPLASSASDRCGSVAPSSCFAAQNQQHSEENSPTLPTPRLSMSDVTSVKFSGLPWTQWRSCFTLHRGSRRRGTDGQ